MITKVLKAAAIAGMSLFALSSYAATVTLTGDTVVYEYDDQQAALALFGAPTIIGDGVRFLPQSFRAQSNEGIGSTTGTNIDLVTANFVFDRVYTKNGNSIQTIAVGEFGDYDISGGDSVSAALLLTVANNAVVWDFKSDDNPVPEFNASGDSGGPQTWELSALIDPLTELLFAPNDVGVTIQNTLTAITDESGETAWIQKKLTFIASADSDVAPPEIPIPAAAWLFGSALLGLVGVARKKRA